MGESKIVGKRVLLADDDAGVRNSIQLLLAFDKHKVTGAQNGKEALELFRREHFDLVITDYAMPEMQGDELAANIRRAVPGQPIIMITAYAESVKRPDNPVDIILSKPFSFQDLRRAIAKVLGGAGRERT